MSVAYYEFIFMGSNRFSHGLFIYWQPKQKTKNESLVGLKCHRKDFSSKEEGKFALE